MYYPVAFSSCAFFLAFSALLTLIFLQWHLLLSIPSLVHPIMRQAQFSILKTKKGAKIWDQLAFLGLLENLPDGLVLYYYFEASDTGPTAQNYQYNRKWSAKLTSASKIRVTVSVWRDLGFEKGQVTHMRAGALYSGQTNHSAISR